MVMLVFFSQFTGVLRTAGCGVFVNLAWQSIGAGLLVFSVLGHLCLRKAILDVDEPHCAFKQNCTRLHAIIYFDRALEYTNALVAGYLNVIAEFTNGCDASRDYVITKAL